MGPVKLVMYKQEITSVPYLHLISEWLSLIDVTNYLWILLISGHRNFMRSRVMPLIRLSWPLDICGAVEATITNPTKVHSLNGDGGDGYNVYAFMALFSTKRWKP